LLLAVSVTGVTAQFVPPVGDALEGTVYIGGALLSIVGYLLYAEVLRLQTAHAQQVEQTQQLSQSVGRLSEEIRNLSARLRPRSGEGVTMDQVMEECGRVLRRGGEVDLWAMCFTGESFSPRLMQLLMGLPPDPSRSVRVRVLVPDFSQPMEIPGLVRSEDGKVTDAPGFRRYLDGKVADFERELQAMRGRMERRSQGTLSVEYRVMRMSPILKLYVIGDEMVFEGIYDTIEFRSDEYRHLVPAELRSHPGDQLLDLIGHDSLLTRWSRGDSDSEHDVVTRRRGFFDALWSAARALEPVS
jgi:hypothetical protein